MGVFGFEGPDLLCEYGPWIPAPVGEGPSTSGGDCTSTCGGRMYNPLPSLRTNGRRGDRGELGRALVIYFVESGCGWGTGLGGFLPPSARGQAFTGTTGRVGLGVPEEDADGGGVEVVDGVADLGAVGDDG